MQVLNSPHEATRMMQARSKVFVFRAYLFVRTGYRDNGWCQVGALWTSMRPDDSTVNISKATRD